MQPNDPLFSEEIECPGLFIDRDGLASCKFEEEGDLPQDSICRKLNVVAGNPQPDEIEHRCPKLNPRT